MRWHYGIQVKLGAVGASRKLKTSWPLILYKSASYVILIFVLCSTLPHVSSHTLNTCGLLYLRSIMGLLWHYKGRPIGHFSGTAIPLVDA